jgi:hypothetical protein
MHNQYSGSALAHLALIDWTGVMLSVSILLGLVLGAVLAGLLAYLGVV